MKLKLKNPVDRLFIIQGFGKETDPSMIATYKSIGIEGHNGLDIIAFDGIPVYAAHDGRVTFAGYDGAGGITIVIRTEEEVETKEGMHLIKTIYGHLKKGSVLVTPGQSVKAGQKIAEADNTGMSTGSHLHFGLKPIAKGEQDWEYENILQNNGYKGAIDPKPYLIPFQQEMKSGETWSDVKKLQTVLAQLGYFNGTPVAKYGPLTANAVLAFQKKYCKLSWYEEFVLKGTKCGPKTLDALNKLWENGSITV